MPFDFCRDSYANQSSLVIKRTQIVSKNVRQMVVEIRSRKFGHVPHWSHTHIDCDHVHMYVPTDFFFIDTVLNHCLEGLREK